MPRPNILLLFTDQHRLAAVNCYGDTPCRTPNIDRLAGQGVRFETTYTVCPVCSPARGTIMTGLYPHAHGITCNVHDLGCCVHELPDHPRLLSRRLGAAGYACGYTGKWHLGSKNTDCFGWPQTPSLPKDVGFEGQNFPGHGGGGFIYPEYQAYLKDHGWTHEVVERPDARLHYGGTLQGPVESTVPWFLADHTIGLLDRYAAGDRPFFLWHNNWGPHGPYFATEEYVDLYRDVEIPPWPNYTWPSRNIPGPHHNKISPIHETLAWDDWAEQIRHYYAFTTMIDAQFGRILKHLDDTGLADNTVVIFTADHGETLGSHGGLTDKGYHHFEEIQRIPLIVRFPDGRRAGVTLPQFASLADVYPTILALAEADFDPAGVHGVSLLPLVDGTVSEWRDDVVCEFHGVNSVPLLQRTLRWQHCKYGWNPGGEDELYDLELDPYETLNRLHDPAYRDIGRELRQRLLAWMERTNDRAQGIFRNNHVAHLDR